MKNCIFAPVLLSSLALFVSKAIAQDNQSFAVFQEPMELAFFNFLNQPTLDKELSKGTILATEKLSLSEAKSASEDGWAGDDEWADEDEWADSDEWGDSEQQDSSNWIGFVELGYGSRLSNNSLFSKQHTLSEVRLHLENDIEFKALKINFVGDFFYDDVLSELDADIREFNLEFSVFSTTDIKIGRQVTTWGTGDLLFVNDQFPKGWPGYFNGRDDTYVKAPANAVRVNSYHQWFNLDFVWTPNFESNRYLTGERFSFFNPWLNQSVGGEQVINAQEPSGNNDEFALRLYKTIQGTEYSLYAYNGFNKQPESLTENFRPFHSQQNVYGGSIRGTLADGLYNIEYAYYDSKDDRDGSNPNVNNSLDKFLIGFESEWFPKVNVSFQYYLERIKDYSSLLANSAFPVLETQQQRKWLTNRVRYQAMQDKLTVNLFSFYSITDKDYFLRWNVDYRQNDNWNYIFGINLLGGEKETTFFAQFEDNSNAFARVRYNF